MVWMEAVEAWQRAAIAARRGFTEGYRRRGVNWERWADLGEATSEVLVDVAVVGDGPGEGRRGRSGEVNGGGLLRTANGSRGWISHCDGLDRGMMWCRIGSHRLSPRNNGGEGTGDVAGGGGGGDEETGGDDRRDRASGERENEMGFGSVTMGRRRQS